MRVYEITKEYGGAFLDFVPDYVVKKIGMPGFHSVGQVVSDGTDHYSAGFLQYYDGELCDPGKARVVYISVPEDERGKSNAWSLLREMNRRLVSKGIKRVEAYLSGEQMGLVQGYFLRMGYAEDEKSAPMIKVSFSDLAPEKILAIPDSKMVHAMTDLPDTEIARVLNKIPKEEIQAIGVRADLRLDASTKKLSFMYLDKETEGVFVATAMPEGGIFIKLIHCNGKDAAKVSAFLIAKAVKWLNGKLPGDMPVYMYNEKDKARKLLTSLKPDVIVEDVWRGVSKI